MNTDSRLQKASFRPECRITDKPARRWLWNKRSHDIGPDQAVSSLLLRFHCEKHAPTGPLGHCLVADRGLPACDKRGADSDQPDLWVRVLRTPRVRVLRTSLSVVVLTVHQGAFATLMHSPFRGSYKCSERKQTNQGMDNIVMRAAEKPCLRLWSVCELLNDMLCGLRIQTRLGYVGGKLGCRCDNIVAPQIPGGTRIPSKVTSRLGFLDPSTILQTDVDSLAYCIP